MYDLEVPSSNLILNILTDPNKAYIYIILALLVLLSAFFAGTETAFSYCNRYRMRVYAEDKKRAKIVMKLLDNFDNLIITTLVGTNIAHVLLSTLATVLLIDLLDQTTGAIVATISSTLIVFFFGDMIPKNIAKENSDSWCMVAGSIIFFFYIIFYPISFLLNCLIKLVCLIFKDHNTENIFTEDDFQDVVEQIEEEGVLDEEESDIIQAAVDFGDIKVKDVLTKKDKMVCLNIKDCNPKFMKEFITKNPYSRIPIYDNNIDNIIGILHVRSYLKELLKNKKSSVRSIMMKPYFVSSQMSLDEIFEGFKEHKTHMAIIKSKSNKVLGLVTMKEVLEELVGEIDEKDTSNQKEVLH